MRALTVYRSNWVTGLLVVTISLFVGASLALQPALAWSALAGLAAILLLQFPPYFVASAAVVAAVFSRLLVSWGILPSFLNFFHFPLTIMAVFSASLSPKDFSGGLANRLIIGLASLGLLSVLSWVASGGEFLRPILGWLLFAEPFLLLYAIVKTAPPNKGTMLGSLAVSLALIQIPFAFWQAATLGLGDVVEGTFVGHGAGAHVVGALTLMGTLAILANILRGKLRKSFLCLVAAALLFSVPVLSDAKQVIIAFIPSVLVLLWTRAKIGVRGLIAGFFVALLVLSAGYLYQPLRMVTNLDLVLASLGGKILSYQIVSSKMTESPLTFLFGLGPGNSVSRTALAAQEGYIRSLPGGLVDLRLSPVTAEILSTTQGFYLFASSSVWSGVSSWLGLFGDFGLLGLAVYGWLLWAIWRVLGNTKSDWSYTGKSVLVMGILLGGVFSWLETPEFTLPWALYMAVGLVSRGYENSSRPQSLPPARR